MSESTPPRLRVPSQERSAADEGVDPQLMWLSGYLVAVTCYHLGTGPKRSGADVGEAVNAAIVVGMGLVLAVHASLTFAVYS